MAKAGRRPKHRQRFTRTRSVRGSISTVSKDLRDMKTLFETSGVTQMLNMAKEMAYSTLSTPYLYDEKLLFTKHGCSKYLQDLH